MSKTNYDEMTVPLWIHHLVRIHENPGVTKTDLAYTTRNTYQTVMKALDFMKSKGLIVEQKEGVYVKTYLTEDGLVLADSAKAFLDIMKAINKKIEVKKVKEAEMNGNVSDVQA